jgi:hypothetical protein
MTAAVSMTVAMNAATATTAPAGIECVEHFEDVVALVQRGWLLRNNSNPIGPTRWFQGDPDNFPAWSGEPDGYVSADADSASGDFPVLSNWLVTPEIVFGPNAFSARSLGFYARALPGGVNRIVVRLCVEGPGTACDAPGPESGDLGGFQTVLADINPDQTEQGFPLDWTGYDLAPADGLPVIGRGRIAFHYYAFWQPDVPLGSVIGIDEVAMAGATACPFTDTVFVSAFD